MERHLDNQLEQLKKLILTMGGHVERAISEATIALKTRDLERFKAVHDVESKINEEHMQVDASCLNILAKQAPVARDLRLILAIIKINTDLERMGDQSVNISHTGKHYLAEKPVKDLPELWQMADIVRGMVKEALDAFVKGDIVLAKKVLGTDDRVDELKDKIFHDLISYMGQNTDRIEAAMDMILIARNLERLGDHATNIAEDVIFAYTGDDVRHGLGEKAP